MKTTMSQKSCNLLVRKFSSDAANVVKLHITVGNEYVPAPDCRFRPNPVVHVYNLKMRFDATRYRNECKLNVTIQRSSPSNRQIIGIWFDCADEKIGAFSIEPATKYNSISSSESYQRLEICGEYCQLQRIISFAISEIKMTILVETSSRSQVLKHLCADDKFTAFELRANDGSIKIHTAVLAACSDVFKTMVTKEFLEKSEGFVELPYSVSTLKQFKAYLYSYKIYVSELEQLAKFAHCYMIPQLEAKCIGELIKNLTVPKSKDLLKFAYKHELDLLIDAVLEWYLDGAIGMEELDKEDTQSRIQIVSVLHAMNK